MTAKSFAIFIFLWIAAMPSNLPAQATSTTAHVRLWKTELHDLTAVRVSFKSAGGRKSAAHEIGGGGPGYLFDNYVDAPIGRGTIEVYVAADKRPLVTLPTDLSPGSFSTVLLREPEKPTGTPQIEIIEDSPAAADPTTAQITVRNFAENLKDVRVSVGDTVNAQFPAGQGFAQIPGLKPATYPISTVGNGADGKPFAWKTETDLKEHRHQTLLIYPDPYGRIRPRLCVDGESSTGPQDEKRGQH